MTCGKALRLRRFFRHTRTVIVPIDHPLYSGPMAGLEDPARTVAMIASTEADGILVSPWVLPKVQAVLGQLAVVARADAGNTALGRHLEETNTVVSAEQALRMGAEMIALNIFIGTDNEADMLLKLGRAAEACSVWGLPLMGEMIPVTALAHHYGQGERPAPDPALGNPVAIATRIGAETGADMIKTVYSGDKDELRQTIANATVPVVIAGGPKSGSDAGFLTMVKDCLEAGAAGVCMGRNVWQRERPQAMIAALCALVHDDATVEDAVRLL